MRISLSIAVLHFIDHAYDNPKDEDLFQSSITSSVFLLPATFAGLETTGKPKRETVLRWLLNRGASSSLPRQLSQ